jgi:hypothetical protein
MQHAIIPAGGVFFPGFTGDRDGELVYQFGFRNNTTLDASDFDLINRMGLGILNAL